MTDWLLRADQNTRVYLWIYDTVAEAGASLAISLIQPQASACEHRRALNRFGLTGGSEG